MVLALCLILTYLVLDTIEDWGYIVGKGVVWHTADAITRVLYVSFASWYAFGFDIKALYFIGLLLSGYWIAFDMLINRSRNLSLIYVGSGSVDKTFKKMFNDKAGIVMLIVKCIVLIIFTWLLL
jgi:hypothetical protein